MDFIQTKNLADKTLKVVHPLVENAKQPSKFSSILLGTLRRDYLTLYTISHMSDANKEDRVAFGDSSMDLSRRVFEDLINIEYIKLKGKEKYSKQFMEFKAVEAYQDLQYLQALGTDMKSEFITEVLEDYEKLPKKLKKRVRWSGIGVEGMIEELLGEKVISEDEFRTLSQTYIAGNYKNHFSPTGIFNFLHNDLYQFTGKSDLEVSLLLVSIMVTKIAMELVEEAQIEGETKENVSALWKYCLDLHIENN